MITDKLSQTHRIRVEAIQLAQTCLNNPLQPPSTTEILKRASIFEAFIRTGVVPEED